MKLQYTNPEASRHEIQIVALGVLVDGGIYDVPEWLADQLLQRPDWSLVTQEVPVVALQSIKGIGPKTAASLREMGIRELTQLANPTKEEQTVLEEIVKVDDIADWQEQAREILGDENVISDI